MRRWWMEWRRAREELAFDEMHPDIAAMIRNPDYPPGSGWICLLFGWTVDKVLADRAANPERWTDVY